MESRLKNSYQGKVAFITGGSSGIGLALAGGLAARGSHVWIMARDQARLEQALPVIRSRAVSANQRFGMIAADVSRWDEAAAAVEAVTAQAGLPDLLINCAGVTYPGYVQDLGIDIFRSMMEINYFGTVYTVKAILPGMIARRSGQIINVSSTAGIVGLFGYSAYGPSKFAVTGFSECLRAELKPHGIGVTVVFPPDTTTPQLDFDNQHKPPETKALSGNVHVLTPEQVAGEALDGAARGKFKIFPGLDNKLAYHIHNAAENILAAYMDWVIRKTQKQIRQGETNRLLNRKEP